MVFQKGHKTNLGRKRKEKIKLKISEAMKKRLKNNSQESDRLKNLYRLKKQKGYINSPEARKKCSDFMKQQWKEKRDLWLQISDLQNKIIREDVKW